MEYPLRPPLFGLRLLSEKSETLKWHNDLRAMEAEVCHNRFSSRLCLVHFRVKPKLTIMVCR